MRLEKQRDVGFYILECSAANNKARSDIYCLDEIIESFWIQLGKGSCKREYDNKSRTISIRNICESEDGFLSLLLSSSDSRRPDPTFEHLETGKQRTEKKQEKEGIGDTAHVVIDLESYDTGTRHLCLIEQVNGLSKTQIMQFLDVESRDVCQHKSFKDIEGKDGITGPKLDLSIIDDTIANDIKKGGIITGLTLISDHAHGDGFDNETWMESSEKVIEIKVKQDTIFEKIMQWVKDKKIKQKYTRLKVNYKTSAGKSRNALAQEKEDSLDFAFGRIAVIELNDPIKSSAINKIHPELNSKMIKLLATERSEHELAHANNL